MNDFERLRRVRRKYVNTIINNSHKRQELREKRLAALIKKTSIKVKRKK